MVHRQHSLGDAKASAFPKTRSRNGISAVMPSSENRFGAQITRLDDLLEEVGADQLRENKCLVRLGGLLLHPLLQPLPLLGAGDVHELRGNGSAIIAAGLCRRFALGRLEWGRARAEDTVREDQARPADTPIGERYRTLFRVHVDRTAVGAGVRASAFVAIASSISRESNFMAAERQKNSL